MRSEVWKKIVIDKRLSDIVKQILVGTLREKRLTRAVATAAACSNRKNNPMAAVVSSSEINVPLLYIIIIVIITSGVKTQK